MEATSTAPAILITVCSVWLATVIDSRHSGSREDDARFSTIDGLRGFLALAVFLHHSSIWYYYLRGAKWVVPPSRLYTHFGETSVVIFFMITGLLFTAKLRNSRDKPIDWLRLYVGRVLRLLPLYSLAMLALLATVYVATHGVAAVSARELTTSVIKWMTFTLLGTPDINDFSDTVSIVAGVTWSLRYEWLFYLALPLLAFCVRARSSVVAATVSLLATSLLWTRGFSFVHLWPFAGGVAASYLATSPSFSNFSQRRHASLFTLVLAGLAVSLSPTAYHPATLACLFLAFSLVAAGCSIFGLLRSSYAKSLGDLTYGLYMIHGILLFVCFRFIIGIERASQFTATEHWAAVFVVAMVLVLISKISFRYIEQPVIRFTGPLTIWIHASVRSFALPRFLPRSTRPAPAGGAGGWRRAGRPRHMTLGGAPNRALVAWHAGERERQRES